MISDAPHTDDVEVADVQAYVSDIRPVRGRGNITHQCTALIEIAGIPIAVHGITLRNDRPHEVGVYLPQHRDSDGVWRPSIEFPTVIEHALATAALE
jgi:hypothetical protein